MNHCDGDCPGLSNVSNRFTVCCFLAFSDKSENLKKQIRTGGSRTARRHTFTLQQKYAKVPSPGGGHVLSLGFSGFQRLKKMESGPFQGGLSVLLFCSKKINNTKRANKHCCRGPQGPRQLRGKCRPPKICPSDLCHQNASRKTCPAQRRVFFCFVFFVATKKMKLLSGKPDGYAFVFSALNPGTAP
jgi:hypothetical protein